MKHRQIIGIGSKFIETLYAKLKETAEYTRLDEDMFDKQVYRLRQHGHY
ncbi:MAG: hypothetical protein IPN43_15860 [Chitinophagaceae bacterium]|nr:hypothetical protein [Chitinophagaceae bacterium]